MIGKLALACGLNVGGLRHVQVIAIQDVLNIPAPVNSVIETSVSLKAGTDFAVIEFAPGSGDFTEAEKETEAGVIMQPRLRISVPKDAPEIGDWANRNLEMECIVLYQDENRTAKIIGDLERPLLLKTGFATGKRYTESNDWDIVLEGISTHKAYYYQMFERKTAGNRKVYSSGYNFGYLRNA